MEPIATNYTRSLEHSPSLPTYMILQAAFISTLRRQLSYNQQRICVAPKPERTCSRSNWRRENCALAWRSLQNSANKVA